MTTLQSNDATGEVVIQGTRADGSTVPPTPKRGHTVRQVDALPPGPGTLRWQDGALVRVVLPKPVPTVISPAQLREWLIRANLLGAVNASLAAIEDPTERQIMQSWFEFASEVRRDNPKVEALAGALGLDAAQIDAAFRAAALL